MLFRVFIITTKKQSEGGEKYLIVSRANFQKSFF